MFHRLIEGCITTFRFCGLQETWELQVRVWVTVGEHSREVKFKSPPSCVTDRMPRHASTPLLLTISPFPAAVFYLCYFVSLAAVSHACVCSPPLHAVAGCQRSKKSTSSDSGLLYSSLWIFETPIIVLRITQVYTLEIFRGYYEAPL